MERQPRKEGRERDGERVKERQCRRQEMDGEKQERNAVQFDLLQPTQRRPLCGRQCYTLNWDVGKDRLGSACCDRRVMRPREVPPPGGQAEASRRKEKGLFEV